MSVTKGTLLSQDFLLEGIRQTSFWKCIPAERIEEFRKQLHEIYNKFPIHGNPIESTTEHDLIEPVIKALGWHDFLTEQTTARKGRTDVPDYLLFQDSEHKTKANEFKEQADRYKHGLAILEAKAWLVPLDRKGNVKDSDGVPSNQMLRYLSSVDVQSNKQIKWGILTNGRYWRLYYQDAQSRSEEFLSLDIPVILGLKGYEPDLFEQDELKNQDWLKVFYTLFCKEAFLKTSLEQKSFHIQALEQGKYWEEKVAQDLSKIVFEEVYPNLVNSLAKYDRDAPKHLDQAYLVELRHATLTLLYRLLFLLYAEDRHLLPVQDKKYDDYGLRKCVRQSIARCIDDGDIFSTSRDTYYSLVKGLCRTIDEGDSSIGIPPYNGGLFETSRSPILSRSEIPDSEFAPILDRLSRLEEDGKRKWINYRDLSVQQLGSIYERLLEFELVANAERTISIRPNIFARKTSGSYYTPESLVRLVLERSVGLLCNEAESEFNKKNEELASKKTNKAERIKELELFDPAVKMLELKICDPAMGSGHFLVSLVDYLADRVLESVAKAEDSVKWGDENNTYHSPLANSIHKIRVQIKKQAEKHKWIVADDQLDDRHIVRRMILKRCVYGVDKNPMAVELAKVSLWLHTFTVGAPLSFLDHHLRYGDSLFGEFVSGVEEYLRKSTGLFISNEITKAKQTAKGMALIEQITDADISEAKESASKFADIANAVKPIDSFFSLIHAFKWTNQKDKISKTAFDSYLDQQFGDPVKIALNDKNIIPPQSKKQASLLGDEEPRQQDLMKGQTSSLEKYDTFLSLLKQLRERVKDERFFHWEIAFPGVWDNWESKTPSGGFDAVIGNPPWDKIRLEEVPWFEGRKPEIAYATRGSDRKKMIEALEKSGDPLWQAYQKASDSAKAATNVASDEKTGQYPLLSGGDINLYSLFVERAHRLVKSNGLVGLVIPSGIASDKGSSEFFRSISTNSRLGAFYDFENKKIFFPDIDSRFKFCTYIASGKKRRFESSSLACFLHSIDTLNDPDRCFPLAAEDFARVNPNTGTAPLFRTKRDAEITKHIYENFPVLVHHEKGAVWQIKYASMFHMTGDSDLFRTKTELAKSGYPIGDNKWKLEDEEYIPLYEGKMVQAYDHRAASVVINADNLKRPGQPVESSVTEKKNSAWLPAPQYFISSVNIRGKVGNIEWYLSFKQITAPTNERTVIASILPYSGAGHSIGILTPVSGQEQEYKKLSPLLLANLNCFVLDYNARQKVQGQNLSWYIVEQLPVIPPKEFEKKIGKTTVGDFIRREVLKLTYTSDDMELFAKDMGYEGTPFIWDEEERRHSKAKLDALFFNLYAINRDDASYILDTFPIVKRQDEAEFGSYRTHDLILAYMNALKAGDTETIVKI